MTALAASAPEGADGEAVEITEGLTVTVSDGQSAAALLDRSRGSWLTLEKGAEVTVSSETPIHGLYVIWNQPPGLWNLAEYKPPYSTPGWLNALHEWVPIPGGKAELTIQLPNGGAELCDLYLFGQGTPPAWVQRWQPPGERADLLALPTHADDEHLFFGGILPTYAGERQLAVQVVYMTNHWGEPYRPHELLDGLWEVGVTTYPVMGPFPDLYASLESLESAEAVFDREAVLAFQVEQLRSFKPRVVVGHDLNGEYGHGAHKLNAATLVEAIELSGDAAAFPESALAYGVWTPEKVYLHLYPENQIVMDWNRPLDHFGGATAFEMAEAGFAKHRSQRDYFTVMQSGTWEDCRKFGLIHTTVGPDVAGDDLFENVDLAPPPDDSSVSLPHEEPVSTPPAPSDVSAPSSAPAMPPAASPPVGLYIAAGAAILALAALVLILVLRIKGKKPKR